MRWWSSLPQPRAGTGRDALAASAIVSIFSLAHPLAHMSPARLSLDVRELSGSQV